MSPATAWPKELAGTAAVSVIEQAIAQKRLSHSLLLQGEDMAALIEIAHAMADRLLNVPGVSMCFPTSKHPDCFTLRPAGKMRIISADATRALIAKVQVTATISHNKVAIVQEADRMHVTAANVFLKTLEEPPRNTTLLLLTTRPYALLPTIRSRVQYFRFPSAVAPLQAVGWNAWMADYQGWLGRLISGTTTKQSAADHLFSLYGLIVRFSFILGKATETTWESQKAELPEDLEDDEKVAIEAGLSNGLRARLFADIERATRSFALPYLDRGDAGVRRPFAATIDALEHSFGLLSLNLNEMTALEDFLLATLRAWTRR
ncbi:MAG: DNA polymerase III subunit gamma/tau [Opitutaceae bacterium]|jgi:DNA polymerase-3 subunit delta'